MEFPVTFAKKISPQFLRTRAIMGAERCPMKTFIASFFIFGGAAFILMMTFGVVFSLFFPSALSAFVGAAISVGVFNGVYAGWRVAAQEKKIKRFTDGR